MQLYMSWYIISIVGFIFTSLIMLFIFIKYSCTNSFHRCSLYTFYWKSPQGTRISPWILLILFLAQQILHRQCMVVINRTTDWWGLPELPTFIIALPLKYMLLCLFLLWLCYHLLINSCDVFTYILQGCFTGTGAIIWLPHCQWSNPEKYW